MVAEGESWRMSESHGCRRFRLAKMANDEPTRGYDLGTLDLDLELELRKTKKRRGSKRRKMGTRTCICSSNMVCVSLSISDSVSVSDCFFCFFTCVVSVVRA